MLMGPVFHAELLRTSRQRRYYVLRVLYALVLLLLIWTGYERLRWYQPVISTADLAAFASGTFIAFAILQLITILLLVPPVFGGAIADEKQRKTLHYIMASQLTGAEIILDKVLGRSSLLAVFVAIGLPVVSILGLFGGISAEDVVAAYLGTFSTVAFAVSLTVLVSTWARRVRDAVVTSFLLVLFWLLVPPLILLAGTAIRPPLYFWIEPVNNWLVDLSPLGPWARTVRVRQVPRSIRGSRSSPGRWASSSGERDCSCCWRSGGSGRSSAARRRRRCVALGSAPGRAGGAGVGSPRPHAATTRSSGRSATSPRSTASPGSFYCLPSSSSRCPWPS